MGAIVDFASRVERAEVKLEKCNITQRNKGLILSFCEYKTAQKVKLPRIAKYLSPLRLIAVRRLFVLLIFPAPGWILVMRRGCGLVTLGLVGRCAGLLISLGV